ncbi:M81 family metallopeptidase [Membranihabitans marinus]|uniref:M81 family metallopeptidase n=1 Tax=Membranihabitans marinus TaxID=1227546 RepID=UPI001F467AB0|nr:M81 family metallopeptidase [Membranihabitans marinus]
MRRKKIYVAGLFHETHTFLRDRTKLTDFSVSEGEQIIRENLGNKSPMDGFLQYGKEQDWDIIPGIYINAMPSGTVEESVIEFFMDRFFRHLEEVCYDIDGIFLVLHGAMASEHCDDVEGMLLEKIKSFQAQKGISLPVVGVLDLHANVSKRMISHSDCLYCYRKNPHTDAYESSVKAADFLNNIFQEGGVKQVFRPTSYVIPPSGLGTDNLPMKLLLQEVEKWEAIDKDLLCINVFAGYAYADIEDCGFSISICTRGDETKASQYIDDLIKLLEQNLESAYPIEFTFEEVLEEIHQSLGQGRPLLLIEASDNIGGGSPGDATGILTSCIEHNIGKVVAVINDPAEVEKCFSQGTGKNVRLSIGGKTDIYHGYPVDFEGEIIHLSNGCFELENKDSHLASLCGIQIDMGNCCVVENEKVKILLTSKKTPPMDLGQLRSQGIIPEEEAVIIVKAAVSHKQAYDPVSYKSIYIQSPGLCTSDLTQLPYVKAKSKHLTLNRD